MSVSRSFCALVALIAAFMLSACSGASEKSTASEASVRAAFVAFAKNNEAGFNEEIIKSVKRLELGGLYEVVLTNGQIFYTDDKVSYIFDGELIDVETRTSLTEARRSAPIDFKALPLDQAVKRVNGNGSRVIATFEDPNCGYCKQQAVELQKIKDLTIYTFIVPILGQDSAIKSANIWCAKDKNTAWTDWILDAKAPTDVVACDFEPIRKNLQLAAQLSVHGTPAIFLSNGVRLPGYNNAEALETALAQVK